MASPIRQIIALYYKKGAVNLLKSAARLIYRFLYYNLVAARGHYSINFKGHSIEFSAPNSSMVERNIGRFKAEKSQLADVMSTIKQEDVVYDIGANTGLYTLFSAKECAEGTVVAFEPYPPNVSFLKQDISRNTLNNINVVDTALSNKVGSIDFSQPDDVEVGYGSSSIDTKKSESSIKIPTTRGDKLVHEGKIPAPNVVKIDVEGAESLVIDGLKAALTNSECRVVYCEVHLPGVDKRPSVADFGVSMDDIRNQLEEMGFNVQKIDDRGGSEIVLKAEK